MEHIIIWTIVIAAALYLIGHFRRAFGPKTGCGGTCSCTKVDWKQLEKDALQKK